MSNRKLSMPKLALSMSKCRDNVSRLGKAACVCKRLDAPGKLPSVAKLQTKLIMNLRRVLWGERWR
jgi:hypothetical protein